MIPRGKLTEVGVIPRDWQAPTLGSLVDPARSIRYGIVQPGAFDLRGRYMVRGQDYSDGWADPSDLFRVSPTVEERYANARIRAGDILITIVGASTGRVAVVPSWLDGANLTQTTARVAIDSAKANSSFCRYVLSSWYGRRQVHTYVKGGAQPGLNCGDIERFIVPLPPTKAEQEAIAKILADADTLIDSLKQLLSKKRLLQQGALQDLLTGKKRLPGFSGRWEVNQLGDCFNVVSTRNLELNDNVVTISAQRGFVRQEEFFKKRVASSVLGNYYLIERGQFAYNRSYSNGYPFGAIKRLSRYDKGVVTTLYFCFALKPEANSDPLFFQHYFEAGLLNSGLSTVTNEGGRVHGLLNITKADFFSREIKRPPLPEQTAIAVILSDVDAEIAALEDKLSKARHLKRAIMQELMTGKTRLV